MAPAGRTDAAAYVEDSPSAPCSPTTSTAPWPSGLTWTASGDEHVRRLASEGTRPFLPWAKRCGDPGPTPRSTLPILDALCNDASEYVRRSVANHLNDLSRQQPDIVVETATRWLAEPDANADRLVRHALRTLVKKGHPGALALLGSAPRSTWTGRSCPINGSVRQHPRSPRRSPTPRPCRRSSPSTTSSTIARPTAAPPARPSS